MMVMGWRSIEYLKSGTARQRAAYEYLSHHQILERLAQFDPVLVSTICVGVDVDSSDLDVVCRVHDTALFLETLTQHFGAYPQFSVVTRSYPYQATVISFRADEFILEVFGAPRPVEQQNAYRHFVILHRLVRIGGDFIRLQIRELKAQGLKTEPAIATVLGLTGDPYKAVLNLEQLNDSDVRDLISSRYTTITALPDNTLSNKSSKLCSRRAKSPSR